MYIIQFKDDQNTLLRVNKIILQRNKILTYQVLRIGHIHEL